MGIPRKLSLALITALSGFLWINPAIADGETSEAPLAAPPVLKAEIKDTDVTGIAGWQIVAPIEIVTPASTESASYGDMVEARLCDDIRLGTRLIAAKGALLKGHVSDCRSPRRKAQAILSSERRLKSKGMLAIQFDEIDDGGGCLYILGKPCKQKNVSELSGSSGRLLEVDAAGNIVASQAVLRGGLKAAATTASVAGYIPVPGSLLVSALATPAIMGVVGAVSPSVVRNRPVDVSERGARVRGMTYGFLSNLPGAFLVLKGDEVELSPGDKMMLDICFKRLIGAPAASVPN